MATISIKDLNPVGYSLFADDESYLRALSADDELSITRGGGISTTGTTTAGCVVGTLVITIVGSIAYTIYKNLQK